MANPILSLPQEFRQRMLEQLGESFTDFVISLDQPAPTSIRINPQKKLPITNSRPIPWTEFGYYLPERPIFTLDPHFHGGCYYVQEASSMFLEQAVKQSVDVSQPLNVLDLCAAPGGKSTHLLDLIGDKSLLVSNEVIRSRAAILAENLLKWGNNNVIVTNSDPEHFQKLTSCFDLIVIDAPCSGEGLFRKDPETIKEWSPDHVSLCANRQKRILSDAWPALKENGILIYSTCTFNKHENEENLAWLAKEYEVEFLTLTLDPDWGIEKITSENIVGYRFYPHRVQGEGFFISVIRKKSVIRPSRMKSSRSVLTPPSKKNLERVSHWVKEPSTKKILQFNDSLLLLPEEKTETIEFLSQHLRIVSAGTALATIKHDKLVPEHALALSRHLEKKAFPVLDVDYENALHYLRKENLTLTGQSKGFALVCYENTPLGWVNVLENRMNNLYPAPWRIRMGS